MEKGEIAHFELSHLFPQCFLKAFYAPVSKDRGHIVLPLSVRPSVHLSVCTNLTWKLNIFPLLLNMIYLQGSCLVWRHISSICICWYQGQGHLQRSRSNIKVTFLKKWPFLGHSCFTNTSCFFNLLVWVYMEERVKLMWFVPFKYFQIWRV